jgi:hypothetical protein
MRYRRMSILGLTSAILLGATGTVTALAQEKGGGEPAPITLSLAVAEIIGSPAESYVRAFVDEVAARSDGFVHIEPIWDAGAGTALGFEEGVASLLLAGEADLALTAGRAWQAVGVTSLLPLQAPFLITDDASAVEVARSTIADDLLAGMAEAGAIGLALWPEDLRHPVAFEPCVDALVTPEQFTGLTVRAAPSAITTDLFDTLGATPVWPSGLVARVATCEIQAAESGLRQLTNLAGSPTLTADVTFFPKYQVLAARPLATCSPSSRRSSAWQPSRCGTARSRTIVTMPGPQPIGAPRVAASCWPDQRGSPGSSAQPSRSTND